MLAHGLHSRASLSVYKQVVGYDGDTDRWLVEWLEGTTKERETQLSLPRLRVYLRAEDPFNFADRVADAHARRQVGRTFAIPRQYIFNFLLC